MFEVWICGVVGWLNDYECFVLEIIFIEGLCVEFGIDEVVCVRIWIRNKEGFFGFFFGSEDYKIDIWGFIFIFFFVYEICC